MTFVALHADRGRVDATLDDLGCGWVWSEIHRRRPRVRLCCQQCDHPVHAKVSSGGLRFFAHDPERRPDCPAARETMEHHLLKLELATAVRSTGWRAELEATRPGAQWRADVLAVSPDGCRTMAWEVQLSSITAEEIAERSGRLDGAGVPVCWVGVKPRRWAEEVPSVVVRPPAERGQAWRVTHGLFRFDGAWLPAEVDLAPFVGWVLFEQVIYYDDVLRRVWTAPRYARRAAETQADRVAQWRADQQRARELTAWIEGAKQRIVAAEREAAEPGAVADRGPITPERAFTIRINR
ncbi:competence protein CoiA family protein [Micromonospora sp. CPCC 205546]|uniref:competence protein CoiA n=1 Tax=Micromonospora TaxID=1873 RepID=UPI002FEFDD9C